MGDQPLLANDNDFVLPMLPSAHQDLEGQPEVMCPGQLLILSEPCKVVVCNQSAPDRNGPVPFLWHSGAVGILYERSLSMKKDKVLFVCIYNSARSQMAEAFLNHLAG